MNKLFFTITTALGFSLIANAQCTLTNATSCKCPDSLITDCDLRPDIQIARLPLTQAGNYTEYAQVCNPPCSGNDGRLRLGVSTPIIGFGPLETRGTSRYVCGTDTIDAGTVANIPTTCPTSGLPPHQLIYQRIYHKSGSTMTYTDRAAGSMTYHPTHGHQHVDNWGIYTLRTQTTDPNPVNWPIVGSGTKLGFCLLDITSCQNAVGSCTDGAGNTLNSSNFDTPQYRNYGLGGGGYGCSNTVQGISNGYMDTYSQGLDGMWIVIPPGTCNGTYYVVVQIDPLNYFSETNENNNVLAIPFTLTKQAGTAVSIGASGPTTFCQGSSVTLTATSGALNYVWSNGATTQSIVVTASGTFTVSCNTGTSCPTTSAPLTVNVTPMNVSASSTPLTVCQGQSVQLTTTTNASPTVNVVASSTSTTQVFIPDNNATGVSSGITISGINPATLGPNSVVSVTLSLTHTYDGDLILSLISPSGNEIYLSNRRGGGGDNFTNTVFTMSAVTAIGSGSAPFTGSFVPDGVFSGLTGNVNGLWKLKVADVAAVDTGRIQNWTLRLYNTVPNVITYNWSSVPGGFSSGLQNPSATPAGTTAYTVSASDLSGCAGSSTVNVTVNPVPVITISPPATICAGANTTLTASGASTYLWSNGATTSSITVSPASTTIYTVTGTTAGCSGTNSVTVTVGATLTVSVSAPVSICAGASTTLSASGGTTYLWSPGGGTTSSISVSPASTTTYTVTGTTAGCSGSNSVTVTVNSLPVVTASNVSGCAGTSIALSGLPAGGSWSVPNPYSGTSTTYTHSYTDANGCSNTSPSANITVNALPVVTAGNVSGCTGTSIALSGLPAGGSWSVPNPYSGASTTYTHSYTDANGCSNTSPSANITVNALPVVTAGNVSGCAGTSIALSGLPAGGSWSVPNPYSGASTTYTYNYTDGNGCSNTSSISDITVNPLPVINTSSTGVSCFGGTNGTVTASATGGTPGYGYSWNTTPIQNTATATGLSGGNYVVTVIDANGCQSSQTQSVVAPADLSASASVTDATCGFSNGIIDLTVSGGTLPYSYSWSPGGASSQDLSGIASGGYAVIITDGNGCTQTQSYSITSTGTTPSSPSSVSGNIYVCTNSAGNLYSTGLVSGATSYIWSVPAGATISTGQGTSSITVSFGANQTSGTICVYASNTCGNSASLCQSLTVVTAKPGVPASISGPLNVCGGATGLVYSCPAVTNAQSYNWLLPSGVIITSGAGTNSITVNFPASFTTGTVRVSASNCAGTSTNRSVTIAGSPATPGLITGAINGVCAGSSGVPYSITPVTNATGYIWTPPTNASITSGQGTAAVTVNYNASFSSGTLRVAATNSCGSSANRSTTVRSIPVTPGTITGSTSVCANQSGVTYSVVAIAGATSYLWTVPTGAIIASGTGTNAIVVNYATSSGKVSVRSVNACGQSSAKSKNISITCRQSESIGEITIFPNPSHDKINVTFYSHLDGQYKTSVTDMMGRIVFSSNAQALQGQNQLELNLSDLAKGIYMFSFVMNGEELVKKVVIN